METTQIAIDVGVVHVIATEVADGDFGVLSPDPNIPQRRSSIVDKPWTWLRQVHGAHIVEVETAGEHAGTEADGAWTATHRCPIAVTTADCAGVALVSDSAVAVVHAGWRGLVSGIIEEAGRQITLRGQAPVQAVVGPCIHPGAYEFGEEDLAEVEARYGSGVRGRTSNGKTALNMPAAVAAAVTAAGWPSPQVGRCTSGERFFSHRTRGDTGRQTIVAWIEP